MPLYERLGGAEALDEVVRDLSERIRVDPLLGPFFQHVDYAEVVEHRADYLAAIFGGPENYRGKGMRDAHRHLDIDHRHMDAFLDLVRLTLEDHDVSAIDIAETLTELDRLRPVLVVAPRAPTGPVATTPTDTDPVAPGPDGTD